MARLEAVMYESSMRTHEATRRRGGIGRIENTESDKTKRDKIVKLVRDEENKGKT